MFRLLRYLYWTGALGCALAAAPSRAYIAHNRWVTTATSGATGGWGSPVTLTWSFAPNGTNVGAANSLLSMLDANWGIGAGGYDLTLRPWFPIFHEAYSRIEQLSGVTFVYEPMDDGVDFSSSVGSAGLRGVRGDIRLGGYPLPSSPNVLARSFLPDAAEMMLNTNQASFFANSANNYRAFRNTLMHETLHGVGLSHVESTDARILMEPFISAAYDGPQLDDILGLQRLYGDPHEKNNGNDSPSAASPLGEVFAGESIVVGTLGDSATVAADDVDFLSIDDDSDADFFCFHLSTTLDMELQLTPKGPTYSFGPADGLQVPFNAKLQSNLALTLFAADGATLLAASDAGGLGDPETISLQLPAGAYLARITGTHDAVQLYQFSIAAADLPAVEFAESDFNRDGQVDAEDLALWKSGVGGDADGDAIVDGSDFLTWQRQIATAERAATHRQPVPEPHSIGLAAIIVAAGFASRGNWTIAVAGSSLRRRGVLRLLTVADSSQSSRKNAREAS